MDETLSLYLLGAASIYLVIGVILVVFAEPIYNWARNSSMPIFTKGLFARAIISYYNVKTRGLQAGFGNWGYCLAFNAGVSVTITFIVAVGVALIIAAVVLFILFAILSGAGRSK